MNLLYDPWIPVRSDGGTGEFRQITYEELLCQEGSWQISLPRDDLEMACLQLLISLTQVLFLPFDYKILRRRLDTPLGKGEFSAGLAQVESRWFDLSDPTTPFMQIREVNADEATPIQKLLVGMPEGNNHSFFNEVGEVRHLSAACTAIALFNQAVNSPSFGGGFKGGLRGGAPVTTLVLGESLRDSIWRNVITLDRVKSRIGNNYNYDLSKDKPTWVQHISRKETIYTSDIGLLRGLFWQPAHVELTPPKYNSMCDLLDVPSKIIYEGFKKEKFPYDLVGVWPHPHGVMVTTIKETKSKGKKVDQKFISFVYSAPAWTQLTEFTVPRSTEKTSKDKETKTTESTMPAESVLQHSELLPASWFHMLVGGYLTNKASILQRRHDLVSIAQGWDGDKGRLKQLVDLGLEAKESLRKKLYIAVTGDKKRGLKGIGSDIQKKGVKLFFVFTEGMLHEILQDQMTFRDFKTAREQWLKSLESICMDIFKSLTDPYTMKPELIPIIVFAKRLLSNELITLKDGGAQNGGKPRKKQKKS
ncbi:MAG TPA: type I-E CRISPR-associated protein Cse1/CasA [Syntrophorhabdaceae bacterium]|nr:type I-E CRISPR-associated protein Cse1/CasA [Syntrophorhabdaceae bacterium]